MKTVLFACSLNAGRSQLATAIFNSLSAPALVRAISAGTHPAEAVQPEVVLALREIGIDASGARPQLLLTDLLGSVNLLINLGCATPFQYPQGLRREDWSLPDTSKQPMERVRQIRDQISKRVWRLIAKEGWYKLQPVTALRFKLPGVAVASESRRFGPIVQGPAIRAS